MPAPEVRAVGEYKAGTAAVSPGLPAGTEAGDLLIMVAESGGAGAAGEATPALTAEGWTAAPKSAQQTGNTRLTVLYKIAAGGDATTTNDTGDHQHARIIGIKKGTFGAFNTSGGGTQAKTKSVSIPGAETTVAECLVIACASGDLPDSTSTNQFGNPTNASLTGLAERIDNTTAEGDGGAIYAATGTKTTAGTYSATTNSASTEAVRGVISLALAPPASFTDSGSGTVKASGTSAESYVRTDTAPGTVKATGSATEGLAYADAGSGTVKLTGSSSESWGMAFSDSATGTVRILGSATEAGSADDSQVGTAALSGQASESHAKTDAATGAVVLSGSQTENASASDSASGAIHLTGSASESYETVGEYFDSAPGTITLSGERSESFAATHEASGTIGLTGSGSDTYGHDDQADGSLLLSGSGEESHIAEASHVDAELSVSDQAPELKASSEESVSLSASEEALSISTSTRGGP